MNITEEQNDILKLMESSSTEDGNNSQDIKIPEGFWTKDVALKVLSLNSEIWTEKIPIHLRKDIDFATEALIKEKSSKKLDRLLPILDDELFENDQFMKMLFDTYADLQIIKNLPDKYSFDPVIFVKWVKESSPISLSIDKILKNNGDSIHILFDKFPNECLSSKSGQSVARFLSKEQVDNYLTSSKVKNIQFVPEKFFNLANSQIIMEYFPQEFPYLPKKFKKNLFNISKYLEYEQGTHGTEYVKQKGLVELLGNLFKEEKVSVKKFMEAFNGVITKQIFEVFIWDKEFKKLLDSNERSKELLEDGKKSDNFNSFVRFVYLNEEISVSGEKNQKLKIKKI